MGGAALHQGCIAEMRTGEGKTLTSTLAVYLNALTGKGVHVATVNDYLARRDAKWMGKTVCFCTFQVAIFGYAPMQIDSVQRLRQVLISLRAVCTHQYGLETQMLSVRGTRQ